MRPGHTDLALSCLFGCVRLLFNGIKQGTIWDNILQLHRKHPEQLEDIYRKLLRNTNVLFQTVISNESSETMLPSKADCTAPLVLLILSLIASISILINSKNNLQWNHGLLRWWLHRVASVIKVIPRFHIAVFRFPKLLFSNELDHVV